MDEKVAYESFLLSIVRGLPLIWVLVDFSPLCCAKLIRDYWRWILSQMNFEEGNLQPTFYFQAFLLDDWVMHSHAIAPSYQNFGCSMLLNGNYIVIVSCFCHHCALCFIELKMRWHGTKFNEWRLSHCTPVLLCIIFLCIPFRLQVSIWRLRVFLNNFK